MLVNVNVKNLALIKECEINFEKGLNILTGETGAGKSIIIGSINIALGAKVSKDIVREGAPYGLVELIFETDDKNVLAKLNALDVVPENGTIIISRKITNGRSAIKVNGETKTASELRQITALLIDVHGQHDHQSLLDESKHSDILDKYGYSKISPQKKKVKDIYNEYQMARKELDFFNFDEEERMRQCSFAQFEIDEIEKAALVDGEDEKIEDEYRLLSNCGRIITAFGNAYSMFENSDGIGINDLLGNSCHELSGVSAYDDNISQYVDRIAELETLARDLSTDMSDYVDRLSYSDERFNEVSTRLDTINHMKEKYGRTISDILEYKTEREKFLDNMLHMNENYKKAKAKYDALLNELKEACKVLTQLRMQAAEELQKEIVEALKDLNFMYVDFKVIFTETESYTANGNDNIHFEITTNPGEPLKPLAKIASGGELSRIMLGLKTIMADQDEIDTLIFDEIDTGISGRTAQLVAEKMNLISRKHQVISITHLPQIAAMADHHYRIEKNVIDNETVTTINSLDETESIEELVRILGGAKISDTVYTHAREMKKMAMETKKSQS